MPAGPLRRKSRFTSYSKTFVRGWRRLLQASPVAHVVLVKQPKNWLTHRTGQFFRHLMDQLPT
jgi:hypothetical protein